MSRNAAEIGIADFRTCAAGETLKRVSPFLSRLGITRLARQTGLDRNGVPVWCAYVPNAKAIVAAQGKGLTDEAARTSAIMEAIERVVAAEPVCQTVEESISSIQRRGSSSDALDCLLARNSLPINRNEIARWVSADDLVSGGQIWVPAEAVQLDRTLVSPRFWQSSDGLASGNTAEEAVLHGLLERVERDALTLWHVSLPAQRNRHRIDGETIRQTEIQQLLDKLSAAELEVALFDVTSDLGIPCVAAYLKPAHTSLAGRRLRHVDVTFGAGASLFPIVAATRAITEAVQSRMTFIAGARDDVLPDTFSRPADPAIVAAFDTAVSRHLHDLPLLAANSTEQALKVLLSRLQSRNISRIYSVDLSPDWLPVSVTKVLVPQLENPDGDRRQRFGSRAISRALQ